VAELARASAQDGSSESEIHQSSAWRDDGIAALHPSYALPNCRSFTCRPNFAIGP